MITNPTQLGVIGRVLVRLRGDRMALSLVVYDGQGTDHWYVVDVLEAHRLADDSFDSRDVQRLVSYGIEIARDNDAEAICTVPYEVFSRGGPYLPSQFQYQPTP